MVSTITERMYLIILIVVLLTSFVTCENENVEHENDEVDDGGIGARNFH